MSFPARSNPAYLTPSGGHALSAAQNPAAAFRVRLIIGALATCDVREFRDVLAGLAARARICVMVDLAGLDDGHHLTAVALLSGAAGKMQDLGSVLTACNPPRSLAAVLQPSRSRSATSGWTRPAPAASRSSGSVRGPQNLRLPPAADIRRTAAVHDQAEVCPVQWDGDQAVITLPERMDVSNAGQIREELLWVINRGAAALVADMTATISCDHAGADAVARAYQRAAAAAPSCGWWSPPRWCGVFSVSAAWTA